MDRLGHLTRRALLLAAAAATPLLIGAEASTGATTPTTGATTQTSTGNTYYASPSSSAASPCTEASPCRLDHAVGAAQAGDTVIVLPGTYSVSYPVGTNKAITIEGAPGQPRPTLVGTSNLGSDTLTAQNGATVSDLDIETTVSQGNPHRAALSITGGVAENLVLSAGSGDGQGEALQIGNSATGTIVRTVLATSQAPGGAVVAFQDGGESGNDSIYNLTAVGTSATSATVSADIDHGAVLIKDSILIGSPTTVAQNDSSDNLIQIQSSDLRSDGGGNYLDGGGNISAVPAFVDAGSGDFDEAAGSPTIDAGTPDSGLSATDLNGNPRVLGAAPDMGAYEFVPVPASQTPPAPTPPAPSPPATQPTFGASVGLSPISGTVLVELPHTSGFERLSGAMVVPVGSVIDATAGDVTLSSVINHRGVVKSGEFHGGRFVVNQSSRRSGRTRLRLLGGSFASCRTGRLTHSLLARSAGHPHHHHPHVVRALWGSDNGGNFTTVGRTASAAVRGTVWLTEDLCGGTLVRVFKGHVVVRPHHHHAITLGPGQSYFARAAA